MAYRTLRSFEVRSELPGGRLGVFSVEHGPHDREARRPRFGDLPGGLERYPTDGEPGQRYVCTGDLPQERRTFYFGVGLGRGRVDSSYAEVICALPDGSESLLHAGGRPANHGIRTQDLARLLYRGVFLSEMDAVRFREPGQLYIVVYGKDDVCHLTERLELRGQREQLLARGVLVPELHDVYAPAHGSFDPEGQIRPGIGDEQETGRPKTFSGVHALISLGGQATTSRRRE